MSNGPTAIPVSPVNDMVAALNAALASHARVPELETALKDSQFYLNKSQEHNQRLELNIIDYKNEIANLTSKVRSLEVERDDAAFRELETADKLNSLLGFARNAVRALDDEINHVDPPKPVQDVAEAAKASEVETHPLSYVGVTPQAPKVDEMKGESAKDPIASSTAGLSQIAGSETAKPDVNGETLGNQAYQPFTPPPATAKPVEITEDSQSNDTPWSERDHWNTPHGYSPR